MVAGGLGAQYEYFSAQVEVKAFDATRANWIESLNLEAEKMRKNLCRFYFEYASYNCEKDSLPFRMETQEM